MFVYVLANSPLATRGSGQKNSLHLCGGCLEWVGGWLKSWWRCRLRFPINRLTMMRTRGREHPIQNLLGLLLQSMLSCHPCLADSLCLADNPCSTQLIPTQLSPTQLNPTHLSYLLPRPSYNNDWLLLLSTSGRSTGNRISGGTGNPWLEGWCE